MGRPIRATICIFVDGNVSEYFQRCLESVISNTPAESIEIRLGFNNSLNGLYQALGALCGDEVSPERHNVPGGIERFFWTGERGLKVRAWLSSGGIGRDRIARLLYHDWPLETTYVVALESSSCVTLGWWEALLPLLEQGVDYIGQPFWHDYSAAQMEGIRTHSWHLGVPFDRRDGRHGVWFVPWGFMAVRSDRLCEVDFPDIGGSGKGDPLQRCKEDVLLGEIARQVGWKQAKHNQHIELKSV